MLESLRALRGVAAVEPAATPLNGRIAVTLTVDGDSDVRPEVFRLASSRGWTLYELHQVAGSLETLFRELTVGSTATAETRP